MKGSFDKLCVGKPDRRGDKVTFILGRSPQVAVYVIDGGHLKIDGTSNLQTPRELEILQAYDRLYTFISLGVKNNKAEPLKYDLGHAVYRALADKNATGPIDAYFADVTEHIHIVALDLARFIYVVSGFLTALIVSLTIWWAYVQPADDFENVPVTALGTLGGVIGAALSIFMRSNSLEISPYKERSLTAFQGASRIALGALFGFVFVCCVKAEFLFGPGLLGKPYGLFAISILAGFSETFVPELLRRLETESGKAVAQATVPDGARHQKNSAPTNSPRKPKAAVSKNRNEARVHKVRR